MNDRFGTRAMMHKEIANISNELVRRCRIGKVRPKPSKLALPDGWKWPGHDTPIINNSDWWKRSYQGFALPAISG